MNNKDHYIGAYTGIGARKTPQESPQVNTILLAFVTSYGSIYYFNASTNTSARLKKSGGSGQGELHDNMNVVFVSEQVCPFRNKVRVVTKRGDQLIPVSSIDKGKGKYGVIEICRKTGNILSMQRAHLIPEVGLRPYEWSDNKRHIGNTIVSFQANPPVAEPVKKTNPWGVPD